MPIQKLKRMYPPRPKELEALQNLDEIKTAAEFLEVIRDEVKLLVNIVKAYDDIYKTMDESKAKNAFAKKQEELKFRVNTLNYLISYGENLLTGKEPVISAPEAVAEPLALSEEDLEPIELSDEVREVPIELKEEAAKEKIVFPFDRDKFVNNLGKEIGQFAVAFQDGRPKTQALKQMGKDLESFITEDKMTRDEALAIVKDSVAIAYKEKRAYMSGIEEILYKQKLLPRFE